MKLTKSLDNPTHASNLRLKSLTPEQVARINEVLSSLGEYGEVHLIIQKGELRYINKVESYKAWNDKPK